MKDWTVTALRQKFATAPKRGLKKFAKNLVLMKLFLLVGHEQTPLMQDRRFLLEKVIIHGPKIQVSDG